MRCVRARYFAASGHQREVAWLFRGERLRPGVCRGAERRPPTPRPTTDVAQAGEKQGSLKGGSLRVSRRNHARETIHGSARRFRLRCWQSPEPWSPLSSSAIFCASNMSRSSAFWCEAPLLYRLSIEIKFVNVHHRAISNQVSCARISADHLEGATSLPLLLLLRSEPGE
jgi:hypothetical protein